MSTLVGTQTDFVKALTELMELEYEALEAYEAVINRIENSEYKKGLQNAKTDHQQHVDNLKKILQNKNIDSPTGPSGTQLISIGKIAIANIFGDKTLLQTMIMLENDTNTAYERMTSHEKCWPEVKDTLISYLNDERRHNTWLKSVVEVI